MAPARNPRFGVAKEMITPPFKTPMAGYDTKRDTPFEAIHDDLFVRTVVLDDGANTAILMSADLCFHDLNLLNRVKAFANVEFGVQGDGVFLSYTHTHSGPSVLSYDYGHHSDAYEEFLFSRCTDCLRKAFAGMFEGEMAHTVATGRWSMNRRREVDGKILLLPNPEKRTDTDLPVYIIYDRQGRVRSLLTTYSCHPVSVGYTMDISADFPGRLCALLEAEFYGCVPIFFQSAGGDSRPLATADGAKWRQMDYQDVDDMAHSMARRVVAAVHSGKAERIALDLAARQFTMRLEIEPFALEEMIRARDHADNPHKFARVVEHYDELPNYLELMGGILRLDDRRFLFFMGGEVTSEIKFMLQAAFPDYKVQLIGYCDDLAYIPSDKMIAEGGFEAGDSIQGYGRKGRFVAGLDKVVLDAYTRTMDTLK